MLTVLASLLLLQAPGNLVMTDTLLGKGKPAQAGDVLTVLYKGTLKDGTVFDENQSAGKVPFAFELGRGMVIRGWDVGMDGIKQGGKRHLEIPPNLAYGDKDIPGIPKNSTLLFDVEVVRIDRKDEKPSISIERLKEGHGPGAKAGDTVNVLYKGMFVNGTKFDASEDHKDAAGNVQPFPVTLGTKGVIPGFEQALMGMKASEKRKVTIPYQLAYKEKGAGGVIPPYSALVFELELVSIDPPKNK